MSKRIAYLITDSGIDGMDKMSIMQAFWEEHDRDLALKEDKNKAWRSVSEVIVNVEPDKKQARAKLNGLERLLLGIK